MSIYLNDLRTIINEMFVENRQSFCETLHLSDRLKNDLEMDSFDMAELTVRIEMKYGIDVFEDGVVYTIEDIVKKLEAIEGDG